MVVRLVFFHCSWKWMPCGWTASCGDGRFAGSVHLCLGISHGTGARRRHVVVCFALLPCHRWLERRALGAGSALGRGIADSTPAAISGRRRRWRGGAVPSCWGWAELSNPCLGRCRGFAHCEVPSFQRPFGRSWNFCTVLGVTFTGLTIVDTLLQFLRPNTAIWKSWNTYIVPGATLTQLPIVDTLREFGRPKMAICRSCNICTVPGVTLTGLPIVGTMREYLLLPTAIWRSRNICTAPGVTLTRLLVMDILQEFLLLPTATWRSCNICTASGVILRGLPIMDSLPQVLQPKTAIWGSCNFSVLPVATLGVHSLHAATDSGHLSVVEFLLSFVDVNAAGIGRAHALDIARANDPTAQWPKRCFVQVPLPPWPPAGWVDSLETAWDTAARLRLVDLRCSKIGPVPRQVLSRNADLERVPPPSAGLAQYRFRGWRW